MPLGTAVTSFQDGVGRTLGFIAVAAYGADIGLTILYGLRRTSDGRPGRADLRDVDRSPHLASGGESDCQTA